MTYSMTVAGSNQTVTQGIVAAQNNFLRKKEINILTGVDLFRKQSVYVTDHFHGGN